MSALGRLRGCTCPPETPPGEYVYECAVCTAYTEKLRTLGARDTRVSYPSEQQETRPDEAWANGEHRDYGLDEVSDDVCPECGHAHPRMDVFPIEFHGDVCVCLIVDPAGTIRFRSGLHPFDTVALLQGLIDATVDPEKSIDVPL